MEKVIISTEYITLGQFLKYMHIIPSGGDAKVFFLTTPIYVNDELEERRGRKLRENDIVMINKKTYQICK